MSNAHCTHENDHVTRTYADANANRFVEFSYFRIYSVLLPVNYEKHSVVGDCPECDDFIKLMTTNNGVTKARKQIEGISQTDCSNRIRRWKFVDTHSHSTWRKYGKIILINYVTTEKFLNFIALIFCVSWEDIQTKASSKSASVSSLRRYRHRNDSILNFILFSKPFRRHNFSMELHDSEVARLKNGASETSA